MLESFPVAVIAGCLLGFLSGLGVGGGSLLILWLTLAIGMEPAVARGINLLFFLPCATVSTVFRWRQGSISFREILPGAVCGCISAILFSRLGMHLDLTILKKMFGILLLVTGVRELLYRPKK